MKTIKSRFDSYIVKNNTIDLTIEEINNENQAYLVDRKLVTYLMASIKSLPFEQLKDNIISKIEAAISVDQIQCIINETVYFNDVAKRFEESERERSEL